MTTLEAYEEAIKEARRFIEKANQVLIEIESNPDYYFGGKHNAAARRSSMDLTRALVEVRKQIRRI